MATNVLLYFDLHGVLDKTQKEAELDRLIWEI